MPYHLKVNSAYALYPRHCCPIIAVFISLVSLSQGKHFYRIIHRFIDQTGAGDILSVRACCSVAVLYTPVVV